MGPSGIDLSMQLLSVAKSVAVSVKNRTILGEISPEIIVSDSIKRFTADGAEFVDGSKRSFTAVIFATGKLISIDSQLIPIDETIFFTLVRLQLFLSIFGC